MQYEQAPRIGAHLRSEGVMPTMFCSHWFITLFAYTLPFDHLLRIWDVFFLEGIKVIFRHVSKPAVCMSRNFNRDKGVTF